MVAYDTGVIKKGVLDHGSSTSVCIPKCNIKGSREQSRIAKRVARELRCGRVM